MKVTCSLVCALILGGIVIGCNGQEQGEPEDKASSNLTDPNLSGGKADVSSRVDIRGRLEYGSAIAGEFTRDLEYQAYTLEVFSETTIDLEITQRGSSRGLDTALFVYGPNTSGSFGDSAIARDDDAGWGRLSALDGLELAEGRYLIVVGTADGTGRGNYNLLATCASGTCQATTEPVDLTSCPLEVEDYLRECIDEGVFESQDTPEDSWMYCSENLDVYDTYETLCYEDAFSTAPDWCDAGEDVFSESLLPNCSSKIASDFVISSDVALTRAEVSSELDLLVEQGMETCDGYCEMQISAYTYEAPEAITATQAVEAMRAGPLNAYWGNDGAVETAEVISDLSFREMNGFLDACAELAGASMFFVGEASFSDTPYPSVDAYHTAYTIIFPETKFIVLLEIVDYSE